MHHGRFTIADVVVGRSRRMRAVFDYVRVIANSDSNVLITGETGTGKEVVANLIHQWSPRRRAPFVAVSCATFSEDLIESELFGHERGAFTDAIKDRVGRYETAVGGTLFLDDVDDVPLASQVKLLRVLQTRTIERVGGTASIPVDVRTIAASKRQLHRMVVQGTFREDLFYRLNVIPIGLPSLRDHREDIPILAAHFLKRCAARRGTAPRPLSSGVLRALVRYPWPGNVRELENACERITQTCRCDMVRYGCLPATLLFQQTPAGVSLPGAIDGSAPVSLENRLRTTERHFIVWALKAASGNKSKAAELLHIRRSTLGDRMKKLGLREHSV